MDEVSQGLAAAESGSGLDAHFAPRPSAAAPAATRLYGVRLYGVIVPAKSTLQRYGLMYDTWVDLLLQTRATPVLLGRENWRCPVCDKTPPSGRTVIDHHHVRGWKKMAPAERRVHVRGIVCVTCNHFILTKYGTPEKFRRAAGYLEAFAKRGSSRE